jgi:hypothetical protein
MIYILVFFLFSYYTIIAILIPSNYAIKECNWMAKKIENKSKKETIAPSNSPLLLNVWNN